MADALLTKLQMSDKRWEKASKTTKTSPSNNTRHVEASRKTNNQPDQKQDEDQQWKTSDQSDQRKHNHRNEEGNPETRYIDQPTN